jgi:membrane protein
VGAVETVARNQEAGTTPGDAALGRDAGTPHAIPWRGWKQALRRAGEQMISDRISLSAAGCAFYATLALFPAITMLIFLYGLVFDPQTVEPQLQVLQQLLPSSAYELIDTRIHQLVAKPPGSLTIGLLISVSFTLWSAATGTKSILSALNLAYNEIERRSFIRFQAVSLGMTLAAMLMAVLAIAILVFLPAVFQFVGFSAQSKGLIRIASLLMMMLFVLVSLSMLYRFGPCRRQARWAWVTPGSLLATVLWVVASALLSFYISDVASYDTTYGPLGAVAGVMMWFYVTVVVVLAGAELNAELEMQTARDSTQGGPRPLGARGAYVADHVADH